MHKAHAVISLISDVGFPAFFLFRILFGQTIFEKNLMDRIVGYVPAVFMLDYCFEAPCARICSLWISRIRSLSASLRLVLGRQFSRCQWLFILHPVSPDSIHCSNANLHFYRYDSGADVIVFSSDNVVDLAGVSLKTLFLLPLPIP